MGIDIDQVEFSPADFLSFRARLEENLTELGLALANPDFGRGPASLGAELEMYIVDSRGRPLYANREIMEELNDPGLTLELNRYNLEINLSPYALSDSPFERTEREILAKLGALGQVAAERGGRVVPIGILPTLTQADFGCHCITDKPRYHALVAQLIARRGSRFRIDINGDDPLQLEMEDITLEGANTSFQIHYRVAPARFVDSFNAIQLATPLAVALGANSPGLFGHSLWHETRVPLFKQSIDTRHIDRYSPKEPARVNFGHGWARRDPFELFTEAVRLYPPLLPVCAAPNAQRPPGGAPPLEELRLHQSTVWLWNRPVYDPVDGGHLRIEMRALPAGPTAVDMVANAAFLIGLAEGLRPVVDQLLPGLPFQMAEYNFYRAAQSGLEAQLVWPEPGQSGWGEQPIVAIIEQMLPVAQRGLDALGIARDESGRYLDVIEKRLASGQSGAVWQRKYLARLKHTGSPAAAHHHMLEAFISRSNTNLPVAEWSL